MDSKYPLALPVGSVLAGQYVIEKVLGQGGFGITYEATDHKTDNKVAVKEFFPESMATRTQKVSVTPFSGDIGESFQYGKTCFLQEAETLAQFIGNDNIVKIHCYFEENGTAYFVMDFVEGTSFDRYIKDKGGKVTYEEAEKILLPVMDALYAVHNKGIVHRDVTPDNIYITKDGVVKLLDFGAARYSLGDKSRSLDVVLKHGFAPKEQYTRRGKQGPFTDVYALGATFYFALSGKRPPDSIERLDEDNLVPPSTLGVSIPKSAEEAILRAMSVSPSGRFQTMQEFKNALLFREIEANQVVPGGLGDTSRVVRQIFFTAPEENNTQTSASQNVQQGFAQPSQNTMSQPAAQQSIRPGYAQQNAAQTSGQYYSQPNQNMTSGQSNPSQSIRPGYAQQNAAQQSGQYYSQPNQNMTSGQSNPSQSIRPGYAQQNAAQQSGQYYQQGQNVANQQMSQPNMRQGYAQQNAGQSSGQYYQGQRQNMPQQNMQGNMQRQQMPQQNMRQGYPQQNAAQSSGQYYQGQRQNVPQQNMQGNMQRQQMPQQNMRQGYPQQNAAQSSGQYYQGQRQNMQGNMQRQQMPQQNFRQGYPQRNAAQSSGQYYQGQRQNMPGQNMQGNMQRQQMPQQNFRQGYPQQNAAQSSGQYYPQGQNPNASMNNNKEEVQLTPGGYRTMTQTGMQPPVKRAENKNAGGSSSYVRKVNESGFSWGDEDAQEKRNTIETAAAAPKSNSSESLTQPQINRLEQIAEVNNRNKDENAFGFNWGDE